MLSFIEPLYKSKSEIQFGWTPESGAVAYNVYVGLGPNQTLLTRLDSSVSNVPSNLTSSRGKIPYTVGASDVQSVLGLSSANDFSNRVFYFAITSINASNVESSLSDSTVVEVPPMGIIPKTMKDDPTINRHEYVFSDQIQRWTKAMGSSSGAVIVDSADFYKMNMTSVYTYDGTNLKTVKSYPSDATLTGMPAKLTTYTYSGSFVTKMVITDSTI